MQNTPELGKNNRCVIWVSPLTGVFQTLSPPREYNGSAFSPLVFTILSWKLHMVWSAYNRMLGTFLSLPQT